MKTIRFFAVAVFVTSFATAAIAQPERLRRDELETMAAAVKAVFANPIVEVTGTPRVDVSVSRLNGKAKLKLEKLEIYDIVVD